MNNSACPRDTSVPIDIVCEYFFLKCKCVKELSQITPGPRASSKNGYIGHFRTVPGRLPFDFTGAGTILTNRTGAGVSKRLLQILQS